MRQEEVPHYDIISGHTLWSHSAVGSPGLGSNNR